MRGRRSLGKFCLRQRKLPLLSRKETPIVTSFRPRPLLVTYAHSGTTVRTPIYEIQTSTMAAGQSHRDQTGTQLAEKGMFRNGAQSGWRQGLPNCRLRFCLDHGFHSIAYTCFIELTNATYRLDALASSAQSQMRILPAGSDGCMFCMPVKSAPTGRHPDRGGQLRSSGRTKLRVRCITTSGRSTSYAWG